ncbi:hypothetical protein GTO89_11705 [Heliobacterium gestii]|uniref:Phosphoribosylformylglycinamidine synthase n=1 Tax=Heliomicrobium gestii TaxID=2699 RepID=A0A845LAD4_HELGE|nr:phosphoribosylformylglycinamidine synthase subunit PurS [Heliomicrobium gestii]MBM7867443.1 phosphoribosylformylglycinamidine (FGAM) synthase PurS component [Heliomicrobium gestii]MZP43707.1 hypothetical protein [Heliomicrobium gestii]
MVKAKVIITVKTGFRDPQREALEQRLRKGGEGSNPRAASSPLFTRNGSGLPAAPAIPVVPAGLRTGRYVEFLVDTDDMEAARRQAEEFCRQRLLNEVLEAFTCEIEPLSN